MPDPANPCEPLDLVSVIEWIDRIADHFETAWQAGPPSLADFLVGAAGNRRRLLLAELVKIDLEHRGRSGGRRTLQEYAAEWPELLGPDGLLPDDLVTFAAQLCGPPGAAKTAPWIAPGAARPSREDGAFELNLPPSDGPPGVLFRPSELPRTLGRFQLVELLGQGTFGAVYKAHDAELGRTVTVKVPRTGAFATAEAEERFLREARSAAQLRHPHVVAVYEAARAEGVPFLVSAYVQGRTLADRLRAGRLTFAEAADLAAVVADALDYAHRMGVVHRDVKPGNILLDEADRPHVTDFGLALRPEAELTLTVEGQVLGTPTYMSPEQAAGRSHQADNRSDLYSLGVILYEMLTGERPFRGDSSVLLHQVVHEEPPPPRRHDRRIPRDLETICLKAMAKVPERRYATAGEFAEDLRRFRADEPIRARPEGRLRRLGRWCRRNPALASLLALVLVLLIVVAGASAWIAHASRARERDLQWEALRQQIQSVRLTPHDAGWSREAWKLVSAAANIRADASLRDQAIATLAGLDADCDRLFLGLGASTVACTENGQHLLLGGAHDVKENQILIDRLGDRATRSREGLYLTRESGPVAVRGDRTPVQLRPKDKSSLQVWDLDRQREVCVCPFPSGAGEPAPWDVVAGVGLKLPVLALSADGQVAAAALAGISPDSHRAVVVWDAATGQPLCRFPVEAVALTLGRDGRRLVVGTADGTVRVWSLPSGEKEFELPPVREVIHGLAFSADSRRLAVALAGGGVLLWDSRDQRGTTLHTSDWHAYAAAFSPDGTLLATGGRHVDLWDVASGRLLLRVDPGQFIAGLAFSPDGQSLAVACQNHEASVWKLLHGRGLHTLRGLTSIVTKVCFTPDGQRLAAISQDGQVGVWNTADGRLLRVLDAPPSTYADNAALAFSSDGQRLACCGEKQARLWHLDREESPAVWDFEESGLANQLAFLGPSGPLLLCRYEKNPSKVFRIHHLSKSGSKKTIREIFDFSERVLSAAVSGDGRCVVVDGIRAGPGDARKRLLMAFDGTTGAEKWPARPLLLTEASKHALDPCDQVLSVGPYETARGALLDLDSGKPLRDFSHLFIALGPGARRAAINWGGEQSGLHGGYLLYRCEDEVRLAFLSGASKAMQFAAFDGAGDRLAWGNEDGTVIVCDLPEVLRRLREVGLAWEEK